jgi:hypothetical protein
MDIAVSLLIGLVAQVIIMVPALWIVGRMLTSSQNAKFTDAIMIVVLGSIASTIVSYIIPGIVGSLVQVIVYLYLIKKYYECSWGKALAVTIVTVLVFVVIAAILATVLGISLGGLGLY